MLHIVKIKKTRWEIIDINFSPDSWATKNCPSYRGFSYQEDNLNEPYELNYRFLDDADALIFALYWK